MSDHRLSISTLLYTFATCFFGGLVFLAWKWKTVVDERVEEVKDMAASLVMTRKKKGSGAAAAAALDNNNNNINHRRSKMASQLEIADDYKEYLKENYPQIHIMSLGEYLDSLEPGPAASVLPDEELEVMVSAALLRVLGPRLGKTLIPAVGLMLPSGLKAMVLSFMTGLAAPGDPQQDEPEARPVAEKTKTTTVLGSAATAVPSHAIGTVTGISLFSVVGIVDLALGLWEKSRDQERSQAGKDSPLLTILKLGDTGTPSFDNLPNPFVIANHWEDALAEIEKKIAVAQGGTYNPHEYKTATPTPVSDVLLPDLHVGAGDAKCTHTNHQVVQNRLFCLLMNRLAANYLVDEVDGLECFHVQMVDDGPNNQKLKCPSDFVGALIRSGHTVKARAACRITTFGYALCVKEESHKIGTETQDQQQQTSWIHIPLAIPLRSGIQSSSTGTSIPGFMTHSNTEYAVDGPFLSEITVESYHNQDGYAGWVSAHYNNLPWVYDCRARELDAVRAAEVTSLLFACINSTALRMNLVNGGYGTIGVCNDSAAIVEATVRGATDIYPLMSIGGFFYRVVKRAEELVEAIQKQPSKFSSSALEEATRLVRTMLDAPNDVHPLPRTIPDTARRILNSMPTHPHFLDMVESISILKDEYYNVGSA